MILIYVSTYFVLGVIAAAMNMWACNFKPHAIDYINATVSFLFPWVHFILIIHRKYIKRML